MVKDASIDILGTGGVGMSTGKEDSVQAQPSDQPLKDTEGTKPVADNSTPRPFVLSSILTTEDEVTDFDGPHSASHGPTRRLLTDASESPLARISRGLEATTARERAMAAAMGSLRTPAYLGAFEEIEKLRRAINPLGDFHERINQGGLFASQVSSIAELSIGRLGISQSVADVFSGLKPFAIDNALGETIGGVRRAMDDAFAPLKAMRDVVQRNEDQQRELRNSLLGALSGPIGEATRTAQWMRAISGDITGYGSRYGASLSDAVASMRSSVLGLETSFLAERTRMSELLGLGQSFAGEFESTRIKMSVLAGIGEISRPRSLLETDAYQDLFGDWHVHSGLPRSFWNDRRERTKAYEEAEVDEGLIHATPGVALEIMIESGLTTGMRDDGGAVAVVAMGEVSMTVRSQRPRGDSFAAVSGFEQQIRAFISRKMEGRFGPDWFKHRASNLIGKAKAARKAAMERGEKFLPLIEFTDLGELATLIMAKGNWDDVFGDVFVNRDAFNFDMQRLVAVRRPTMHARPVDGVLLVEMLCVMQRLSAQIVDDGAWKIEADLDR